MQHVCRYITTRNLTEWYPLLLAINRIRPLCSLFLSLYITSPFPSSLLFYTHTPSCTISAALFYSLIHDDDLNSAPQTPTTFYFLHRISRRRRLFFPKISIILIILNYILNVQESTRIYSSSTPCDLKASCVVSVIFLILSCYLENQFLN